MLHTQRIGLFLVVVVHRLRRDHCSTLAASDMSMAVANSDNLPEVTLLQIVRVAKECPGSARLLKALRSKLLLLEDTSFAACLHNHQVPDGADDLEVGTGGTGDDFVDLRYCYRSLSVEEQTMAAPLSD
jgi:hypothetical protein